MEDAAGEGDDRCCSTLAVSGSGNSACNGAGDIGGVGAVMVEAKCG